jgi:DNA-binding HxlR family transcriptional regulator
MSGEKEEENVAMVQEQAAAGLQAALSRVGDRWVLLVIDALQAGPKRFGELQEALGGIATNVLTQRLRRLEKEGVVVALPYSTRPPRYAYELTAAGRELAGALLLLTRWGSEHARADGGPVEHGPHHQSCGSPLEPRWYCPTCDRVVLANEADVDDLRWV